MTAVTSAVYEVVIGLEVHVQLRTRSKMFCSCPAEYFDAPPNSHVCAVCFGMPGMLPVINRRAVDATILSGLALGSTIPPRAKFDRKNYPYPDLMKGYQISQYDEPFCVGGALDIEVDGVPHHVRLERIHLEEDTARLLHRDEPHGESYSLLDVNRSGVPLMEVVSAPDMRSAAQAVTYLRKLRQTIRYIDVSDADMEKGSFRCDANVSLRLVGAETLGAKVEVKNMNSFRAVQRAIEFEIERQAALLDAGAIIDQETRGYIDATGATASQRSKEAAHDYRYFPEPDLPPLAITAERIATLRAQLPELPDARRVRFEQQYGLASADARLLTETRAHADAYEETVGLALADGGGHGPALSDAAKGTARAVAHWFTGDLARLLHSEGGERALADTKLTPAHVAELATLAERGVITLTTAKEVLELAFDSGERPAAIVAARGLAQVRDEAEIDRVALAVIAANEKAVADYRGGKPSALQFLVGQLMRQLKGRADAAAAADVFRRHLDGQPDRQP
ncbi:MAG: Asp-tRNA(Asn)/Glu-tRNA(Gln) amidotransferase subunit GatB [Dehalococcoidia bacterium]|nr:Asp-tRNA(Asn)/Glu-tRNA(Gln) amidotransferase subunit GatB [Dehalococcoidia bacterium]